MGKVKNSFFSDQDNDLEFLNNLPESTVRDLREERIKKRNHLRKQIDSDNLYGFHQFMNLLINNNIRLNNLEINNQKLDDLFEELYS